LEIKRINLVEQNNKNALIISNTDLFFLLHRSAIARSLESEGYEITAASKNTGKRREIEHLGFKFIDIDFVRKSISDCEKGYNVFNYMDRPDFSMVDSSYKRNT